MKSYYLTTPIYYINDKLHIGHAYSTIVADILARYHRQKGDKVLFSTGVDENAQKTVNAASTAGTDAVSYTNSMSGFWEETWKKLGITNDVFIRTTAAKHRAAVYAFIERVQAKGDIVKGVYEGYYCVGCESFKKEDDLVGGLCPDHKKKPEWLKEENYFFTLSAYQQQLLDHIESHPEFIKPESRRNEVLAFIRRGLQDFSVSRSTQKWGIPWPDDEKQVVYVWFDALVNYLTAAGFPDREYENWWPANLHLVGKDIIKFHCTYWPAMLLSAGLPLPKTIFAHGFFTIDGQKISKSLGNTVDPLALASRYGADALRYFLLSEIPFGGDGDFSFDRIAGRYESDLSKGLGNFVSRVTTLASKLEQVAEPNACSGFKDVKNVLEETWAAWEHGFETYALDEPLAAIWKLLRWGDKHIEETKPWALLKNDPSRFSHELSLLSEIVRHVSLLIKPILPETSLRIESFLGVEDAHAKSELSVTKSFGGVRIEKVEKAEALFPPIIYNH